MSWGELSCKIYQQEEGCPYGPTMETCNTNCPHYVWDGRKVPEDTINLAELHEDLTEHQRKVTKDNKPNRNRMRKLRKKGKLK